MCQSGSYGVRVECASSEDERRLDDLTQLANVARPRTLSEQSHGVRIERPASREVPDQRRDVVGPLVEWWDLQNDPTQAMGEVGAHASRSDEVSERFVGGRDQSKIAHGVSVAANSAKRSGLERAKELRLHRERQAADLVEKERALVGFAEIARHVRRRAGECTAHVPEERILEHRVGDRTDVERDEPAGSSAHTVE